MESVELRQIERKFRSQDGQKATHKEPKKTFESEAVWKAFKLWERKMSELISIQLDVIF